MSVTLPVAAENANVSRGGMPDTLAPVPGSKYELGTGPLRIGM
jgi:hypothetical protein